RRLGFRRCLRRFRNSFERLRRNHQDLISHLYPDLLRSFRRVEQYPFTPQRNDLDLLSDPRRNPGGGGRPDRFADFLFDPDEPLPPLPDLARIGGSAQRLQQRRDLGPRGGDRLADLLLHLFLNLFFAQGEMGRRLFLRRGRRFHLLPQGGRARSRFFGLPALPLQVGDQPVEDSLGPVKPLFRPPQDRILQAEPRRDLQAGTPARDPLDQPVSRRQPFQIEPEAGV